MKMKRLISFVIVLLLVCGMPVSAFADEYDLSVGSITVNASESGQTVSQDNGVQNHQETTPTVITQSSSTPTTNTVTINAAENATANVTIQDVNINTGSRGGAAIQTAGAGNVVIELDGTNTVQSIGANAGVQKTNGGNLTIADENGTDGSLKATGGLSGAGIGGGSAVSSNSSDITISGGTIEAIGGDNGAGIGGGAGESGSNITISGGNVEATGGESGGAGIGGGGGCSGNNITITGSAEVTAKGGDSGAGIGGGRQSTGSSDITVSGDAQVKAQGGCDRVYSSAYFGSGAAIGEGGKGSTSSPDNIAGDEVDPNTNALTTKGKIEYYAPGANMENDNPIKTVTGTVPPQDEEKPPVDEEKPDRPSQPAAEGACYAPLYRVINQDGKDIPHQAERKDGVLTLTVDADCASLTGRLGGIQTLKAQGVDTIVFVTKGASSTFALADLLAQGSTGDSYTLTHDGDAVTFTLNNGTDISSILQ